MIKTISYWSLGSAGDTVAGAVQAAKNAGFPGIELAIAESGPISVSMPREVCQQYRDEINKNGLICETLASGMSWGCSPTHPDEAVRKKSIALHAAALECAAWLGCKAMLFVPGAVKIPWDAGYRPVPYDKAVAWAREAVAALTPVAEKAGVDLCIENVWNGMFYSPLELRDFIDSFKSPRVGSYFDAGNVLGYHQYPPHWIEILGARIKRVHIKDYKTSIGGLAGFCDLLAGDVPWAETMHALRAIGYDKTIVAEMLPPDAGMLARTSVAMDVILKM